MKTSTLWIGAMLIAVCGWFLPSATMGANPTQLATAEIQDIVLRPDHSLHGLIVDIDGQVNANDPVTVFQDGKEVARAETDVDGRFVACGLRGGSCVVRYPDQVRQYRVWTHQAAPPSACGHIFHRKHCRTGQAKTHNKCGCAACQQHGQCRCEKCHRHGILGGHLGPGLAHSVGGLMKSPLGLAAIGAAVAVPIALNNDDDKWLDDLDAS